MNKPILVLASNTAWSIWNFRRSLIRHLMDGGYHVVVVAPEDEAVENIRSLGCDFVAQPMDNKGTNPLRDAGLCRAYWQLYRRLRPQAVLNFTIKPVIYGGMACRLLGIPYVSMITGLGTAFIRETWLTRVVEGLYRLSQKGAHGVLFQNPDDAELFTSRGLVPAVRVRQVPGSGIDLNHFSPMPLPQGAAPIFLVIARLLRDKGIVEFVAAARLLRQHYPAARFQLLGAIGVENRTAIPQAEVEEWVAEGLVEYLGVASDVRPHIAAASCVVLPSYREGTPRSMLEAAAMGRPLIATDVPGCRQVLDHGRSGLLCEVRSAESLAQAMAQIAAMDASSLADMGAAGRRKMEAEFGEALVFQRYDELLSHL